MTKEYFLKFKSKLTILKEASRSIPIETNSSVNCTSFIAEISKEQFLEICDEFKKNHDQDNWDVISFNFCVKPDNEESIKKHFKRWPNKKARIICIFIDEGWKSIVFSEHLVGKQLAPFHEVEATKGHGFGALISSAELQNS